MATTAAGGLDRQHALDLLTSPVRRDLLDTLANLPYVSPEAGAPNRTRGLTAAELGERLDLHVTTVRFHLDQLVQVGLVVAHDERGQVGRPKKRYCASPGPLPSLRVTEPFLRLAEVLDDILDHADVDTAEMAGRRWFEHHGRAIIGAGASPRPAATRAEWFAKIGSLVDLLDEWGYAPEVRTTDSGHTAEVCLNHCPLRDLVETAPDIACGMHRGIIQGAMEALGEHDAELRVLPLVEPDLCLARVTTSHDLTHRHPPSDSPATSNSAER